MHPMGPMSTRALMINYNAILIIVQRSQKPNINNTNDPTPVIHQHNTQCHQCANDAHKLALNLHLTSLPFLSTPAPLNYKQHHCSHARRRAALGGDNRSRHSCKAPSRNAPQKHSNLPAAQRTRKRSLPPTPVPARAAPQANNDLLTPPSGRQNRLQLMRSRMVPCVPSCSSKPNSRFCRSSTSEKSTDGMSTTSPNRAP